MLALQQNHQSVNRIITGCLDNDPECQRIIYEKYYDYAFKVAFRYINSYNDVADVVNDAFAKMFKDIGGGGADSDEHTEDSFLKRLRKTVALEAVAYLRRGRWLMPDFHFPEIQEPPDAQSERYKEIITHLKRLPAQYRVVFNMSVMDNFSEMEISKHLNITPAASRACLQKARAILARRLRNQIR